MATYGANVLTGGTASASTDRAGLTYAASKAVDADESTRWATDDSAVPGWWRYDLGSGVTKTVEKIGFVLKSSEITKDFSIAGSNDATNWTFLYKGVGTNDQNWQYYAFVNPTAFRYYQINVATIYSGAVASISQIEAYECTDPTGLTDYRLCSPGTVTSSTDRGAYENGKADDGLATTRWATPDGVTTGWWKLDLGAGNGRIVTKFDFITVSGEIPNAFVLAGSNDDSNWTDLLSTNGANVQTWQTFAVTNTAVYRYYRVTVSTVWAGIVVSVSEFAFYELRGATPPPAGEASFQAVFIL